MDGQTDGQRGYSRSQPNNMQGSQNNRGPDFRFCTLILFTRTDHTQDEWLALFSFTEHKSQSIQRPMRCIRQLRCECRVRNSLLQMYGLLHCIFFVKTYCIAAIIMHDSCARCHSVTLVKYHPITCFSLFYALR